MKQISSWNISCGVGNIAIHLLSVPIPFCSNRQYKRSPRLVRYLSPASDSKKGEYHPHPSPKSLSCALAEYRNKNRSPSLFVPPLFCSCFCPLHSCFHTILFLLLSSPQLLPYYYVPAPVLSIAASQLFCYPFYFPLYSSPSPFLNVGGIGVILLFLVHFILVVNITFRRINVLEASPPHTQSLSFLLKYI